MKSEFISTRDKPEKLVNIGGRAGILGVRFSPEVNTPGTIEEYADGNGDPGAHTETAQLMLR
jgi:hypothetical protein